MVDASKPINKIEICTCTGYSRNGFEFQRNELIKEGWKARGDRQSTRSNYGVVYYQFMEREVKA